MRRMNYQRGQSIVEVVLAAGVVMVSLSVMVMAVVAAIANNRVAKERAVATRLSQEVFEWMREFREERNYDGMGAYFHTSGVTHCLDDLPSMSEDFTLSTESGGAECSPVVISNTRYVRKAIVSEVLGPSEYFDISVIVTWDASGKEQKVENQFLIYRHAE